MDNLTRTRHERMLALDRKIRSGEYPNCATFARYWQERFGYEKRLDRRTIMRDIAYLQDMHRAPIEFDIQKNGYYYTDASWTMPPFLAVNEPEMLNLLLAWRAMSLFRETPLAKSLSGLFDKLSAAMAGELGLDGRSVASKFSFYASPGRPVAPETWKAVFDGVRLRRVLEIDYAAAGQGNRETREILPLHLANVDGEWYVTAYCRLRQDYRHFALSRIHAAREAGGDFEEPDDFDPAAYYANRFARFLGPQDGEPVEVTVRFTPAAAPWVMERTWHSRQKTVQERNGGLRLTLPMPSLIEAKRWVLAWGAGAEVLTPVSLRNTIADEAKKIVRRYVGKGWKSEE